MEDLMIEGTITVLIRIRLTKNI